MTLEGGGGSVRAPVSVGAQRFGSARWEAARHHAAQLPVLCSRKFLPCAMRPCSPGSPISPAQVRLLMKSGYS